MLEIIFLQPKQSKAVARTARRSAYTFEPAFAEFATDRDIIARNALESPTRTNNSTIGGGDIEWGAWVELKDEAERVTPASLAFLADISANMTDNLRKEFGKPQNRYATVYQNNSLTALQLVSHTGHDA